MQPVACDPTRVFSPRDCRQWVCDDKGRVVEGPALHDVPTAAPCQIGRCGYHAGWFEPAPAGRAADHTDLSPCAERWCDGYGHALYRGRQPHPALPDDDANLCTAAVCMEEVATEIGLPDGATLVGPSGQCSYTACQASSATSVSLPLDATTSDAIAGNCASLRCDGNGGSQPIIDDADVPKSSDPCIAGGCDGRAWTWTQLHDGEPCGFGQTCWSDGSCRTCTDPGPSCDQSQTGEPNDELAAATPLGSQSDFGWTSSVCGALLAAPTPTGTPTKAPMALASSCLGVP